MDPKTLKAIIYDLNDQQLRILVLAIWGMVQGKNRITAEDFDVAADVALSYKQKK